MLHLISQNLKAIARRTLGEIFPHGDVAALAEVLHPNFVDHACTPNLPLELARARQPGPSRHDPHGAQARYCRP